MVKQSQPLSAAAGNRAPDAVPYYEDSEFALVLCAMNDLDIESESAPSSVAGSRGTTPIASRGTTPFAFRNTTPIVPRNRTRGPIRTLSPTPSPTPRGRLASAAAAASSLTSRVTALLGRSSAAAETQRADQSHVARGEALLARADEVLASVAEDNATPRPRADPLSMLPEAAPVRALYAAAAANAAEARASNLRRVPRLRVEAVATAAPGRFSTTADDDKHYCGVCLEYKPSTDMFAFECGHTFCKVCTQRKADSMRVAHEYQRPTDIFGRTLTCEEIQCMGCNFVTQCSVVDEKCRASIPEVQQDAPKSTRGFVQKVRATWSQVASGMAGVLAGEEQGVFPESSVASFDPENGLVTAGSSTKRSVASEISFDPERSAQYGSDFESEDEAADAAKPASAKAGVHGRAKFLYTEDYLNGLNGPELRELRKKHKDEKHLGPAKQHATMIDLKDDLMQLTTDHALN